MDRHSIRRPDRSHVQTRSKNKKIASPTLEAVPSKQTLHHRTVRPFINSLEKLIILRAKTRNVSQPPPVLCKVWQNRNARSDCQQFRHGSLPTQYKRQGSLELRRAWCRCPSCATMLGPRETHQGGHSLSQVARNWNIVGHLAKKPIRNRVLLILMFGG